MKSKLIIIGITILLILTNAIACYATDISIMTSLLVTLNEVKVGESFTVTFNVQCSDGINGIATTYSYDEDKLELVSATAGSDFANLGTGNAIELISNASTSITNADVYTFTFKVKEGVEIGSEAKISISEGTLDSDALENSTYTIEAKEVTVTVVAEEEENPPADDGTGDEEQNPPADDGTGDEEQNPPADDGAGDEEQNPPADDGAEDKEQETTPGTTVVVGDDKKDDTTADKDIPKAGLNTILVIGILGIVIVAVVMYRKNQKYKDIK